MARFIDGFILSVPIGIIYSVIIAVVVGGAQNSGSAATSATLSILYLVYGIFGIASILYYVLLWGAGGTLGQKVFGLRVVDAQSGQTIGAGRAVIRLLGYVVSSIPCYLGLIWAAFDERKQGWHDKMASTVVIRTR